MANITGVLPLPGFPEAPKDGTAYGRRDGGWVQMAGGSTNADTLDGKDSTFFAPINAPVFTGNPTAPTPATSDNDTSLATTAFVKAAITAAATAEVRNRVINGGMQISQENYETASPISSTNTYYAADQFYGSWVLSPGTAATQWTNQAPLTANGNRYVLLNIGTPKASLSAADHIHIGTPIEGRRVQDFQWGTANAKPAVLTFLVYSSSTGTYAVAIRNNDNTRSYLAPFTITATGVWQRITLAIPGDTTGTWLTDSGIGMTISFMFAAGSTFNGVAGWQAGNKVWLPGGTNFAGAVNSLRLSEVGLYRDPAGTGVAPPWITPEYDDEVHACFRYWQWAVVLFAGNTSVSTGYYGLGKFQVPMRVSPTFTGTNGANYLFAATPGTFADPGSWCVQEYRVANGGGPGGLFRTNIVGNARM